MTRTKIDIVFASTEAFMTALRHEYPHISDDQAWDAVFAYPCNPTKDLSVRVCEVEWLCQRLGVDPVPLLSLPY